MSSKMLAASSKLRDGALDARSIDRPNAVPSLWPAVLLTLVVD